MNAQQALKLHLQKLESLNSQADDLRDQLAAARRVVTEAEQPRTDVEALRQQRRETLGAAYPGKPEQAALDKIDKQTATAFAALQAAEDRATGAAFAADVLTTKNDALQREIAPLQAMTAALLYQAHVEHATAAAQEYRAACQQLAHAHAVLQARCLAADQFAQPSASPARTFTIGSAGTINSFDMATPNLPGLDHAAFSFNMSAEIQAELLAALQDVGGLDAVKSATVRQMHDRIYAAERTMQAQIRALNRREAA